MGDRKDRPAPVLFGDLAAVDVGLVLRHDGRELAAEDRKALLERVRAGEALSIEFDAVTFIQRETPNRNFLRIRPGALGRLAKSFRKVPFLRDHDQRHIEARGGTVLKSDLVKDVDGGAAIHMTIAASKPWAVEGVLDGTIDRFSIGWLSAGPVLCSVHNKPVLSRDDYCWPGDEVDGKPVEFVFTDAEGIEVSGVNVPAVVGTGIDEVRAAVAALSLATPDERRNMDPRILAALGLSEASTDNDVVAAAEKLQADAKRLAGEIDAARELLKATEAKLEQTEGALKIERDRIAGEKIDARILEMKRVGALPVGESAVETWLRARGKDDGLEVFEKLAGDLKPGVYHPGGAPRQLEQHREPPREVSVLDANPEIMRIAALLGYSKEQVLELGLKDANPSINGGK